MRCFILYIDVGKKGQIVKINSENAYEYIMFSKAFYATPENIAKVKKLADSEVDKYSSLTAYKVLKQNYIYITSFLLISIFIVLTSSIEGS